MNEPLPSAAHAPAGSTNPFDEDPFVVLARQAMTGELDGALGIGSPRSKTRPARSTQPIPPAKLAGAQHSSKMFGNMQRCSPVRASQFEQTNPPGKPLTIRQRAAARQLVLGLAGRAVARTIGVEEHTITRWRRLPAFEAEVQRLERAAVEVQLGASR